VNLRPATPGDVPAVAALEQVLFGPDAWSGPATAEELTGADRRAVVVCDDAGAVVGYAVTRRSGDLIDLHRIGVVPPHRRAGVGRTLLDALREDGRADGATSMLLEVSAVNSPALGFYAAEGFVEIDRRARYYRDGSDAVVLHASLALGPAPGSTTTDRRTAR